MPSSNPFYIPQVQMTGLRNVPKYDPFLGLREAMLMQRAMQPRGGGRGSGPAIPQEGDLRYGTWMTLPDGTKKWVWGKTEKDRKAESERIQQQYIAGVLNSDPDYKKNIEGLSQLSIPGQKERIAKLRDMAPRLAPKLGLSEVDTVKLLTDDASKNLSARETAVKKAPGEFWGSLGRGALNLWDAFAGLADNSAERLARAQAANARERQAAEENAYTDEIERLRKEERSTAAMQFADNRGLRNLLGNSLTDLGAVVAAQSGGAALGAALGAATPVPGGAALGGLAGAMLGGATSNAPLASFQFARRIADDSAMTEAEKIQAIENNNAALYGAAVGAATASPVGALGRVASAVPGRIGQIATGLRQIPAQTAPRAIGRGIAQNAVDAAALGAADLMSQNLAYNQATRRDVPLTEGLGEAVASGAILGLPFGLTRGFGARARRAAWEDANRVTIESAEPMETLALPESRIRGNYGDPASGDPIVMGYTPKAGAATASTTVPQSAASPAFALTEPSVVGSLGWRTPRLTTPETGYGPIAQGMDSTGMRPIAPQQLLGLAAGQNGFLPTPTLALPMQGTLPAQYRNAVSMPGAVINYNPVVGYPTGIHPALPFGTTPLNFDRPVQGTPVDIPVPPMTQQVFTPNIKAAKNVKQLQTTLAKADDPAVLRAELDTLSAKNWKRKYIEARIGELENGNRAAGEDSGLIGQAPRLEPVERAGERRVDNADTPADSPAAAVAETTTPAVADTVPGTPGGSNPAIKIRRANGARTQDTRAVAASEAAPLEQGAGGAEGANRESGVEPAAFASAAAGESAGGVEPAERSSTSRTGNEPAVSAEQRKLGQEALHALDKLDEVYPTREDISEARESIKYDYDGDKTAYLEEKLSPVNIADSLSNLSKYEDLYALRQGLLIARKIGKVKADPEVEQMFVDHLSQVLDAPEYRMLIESEGLDAALEQYNGDINYPENKLARMQARAEQQGAVEPDREGVAGRPSTEEIVNPNELLEPENRIDSERTLQSMSALRDRLDFIDEDVLTKLMKEKDVFLAEDKAERLLARKALSEKLKPAEEKQVKALLKAMDYDVIELPPGELANIRKQYGLAKEQGLDVTEAELMTKTTAEAQRRVNNNPACGV